MPPTLQGRVNLVNLVSGFLRRKSKSRVWARQSCTFLSPPLFNTTFRHYSECMKCFLQILFVFVFLASADAQTAMAASPQSVPQSRAQITFSFAPIVKQVTPAVVNIYTQRVVQQRLSPLFNDPFFRQFFGAGLPQGLSRERMENSLGSGVIVRPDGLIVTSRHVIADADQIRVVLSDRREFDAKLVMADEHADLAVLRIEARGETFPYLELRDSDEAEIGDLVLAIGNPFGVGQTVTSGIISAMAHQSVGASDLDYFIQTDAAINPGNSGGALVTMDGKLVGINAAIYSRDGGNMGIGFAVPANLVRTILSAVTQGKAGVTHPWIGIAGQAVTQEIALSLGMTQPTGVLVKGLHAASPAAKAGLHVGDVITSVNGREVEDQEAFHYRIATLSLGSTADLGIIHDGQKSTLHVSMIAPPEEPPREETLISGHSPISGATIANLSPAVAEDIGLQDDVHGVVVTHIKDASLASQIGLQVGDILVALNGQKLENVSASMDVLRQSSNGWRLTIRRQGNEITMRFGN
jgi:serine protease Do